MIILREKDFTFADQKALMEFMRATNGFRTVPKGYKNLDAKDIITFKELANQANRQGFRNIDRPKAKELLSKVGLTSVADNLDHLIHKYNDPKLIARYRRLQKHNLSKQVDDIVNKVTDSTYNKAIIDRIGTIDKDIDQVEQRLNNLKSKGDPLIRAQKLIEKYQDNNKITTPEDKDKYDKFCYSVYNARRSVDNDFQYLRDKRTDLFNSRKQQVQSINIPKLRGKYILDSDRFVHNLKEGVLNSKNSDNKNSDTIKSLMKLEKPNKGIKKVAKDRGVNYYISNSKDPSSYNTGTGNITINKDDKYNPFFHLHEVGHKMFERVHPEIQRNIFKGRPDDVETLASELGASAHAMAQAKRLGYSPQLREMGRQSLENGFNTYFAGTLNHYTTKLSDTFNPDMIKKDLIEKKLHTIIPKRQQKYIGF